MRTTIQLSALDLIDKVINSITTLRHYAPAPQFKTQDEYRLSKAACTLSLGAEKCDPAKNPWANSALALLKDVALPPVNLNGNSDRFEFSWGTHSYRLLCGAKLCTVQREVPISSGEGVELLVGCSTPPSKVYEDVGSFEDIIPDSVKQNNDITGNVVHTHKAVSVSNGLYHSCAITDEKTVYCWGSNNSGQLGRGKFESSDLNKIYSPSVVPGLTNVKSVVTGHSHTCALQFSGTVLCWGLNNEGQVGVDQLQKQYNAPEQVSGLNNIAEIAAGDDHNCALTVGGIVACWGSNDNGELGIGKTGMFSNTPTPLANFGDINFLLAGNHRSCALMSGDQVYCWGNNSEGEITTSLAGNSFITVPTKLDSLGVVVSLGIGSEHMCAAEGAGNVECWGKNSHEALGFDVVNNLYLPPTSVHGIDPTKAIYSGGQYTCALTVSNSATCWGAFDWGISGATSLDHQLPTTVPFLYNITEMSVSKSHACAITSDAGLYCWGLNSMGQLGQGSSDMDNHFNPELVILP